MCNRKRVCCRFKKWVVLNTCHAWFVVIQDTAPQVMKKMRCPMTKSREPIQASEFIKQYGISKSYHVLPCVVFLPSFNFHGWALILSLPKNMTIQSMLAWVTLLWLRSDNPNAKSHVSWTSAKQPNNPSNTFFLGIKRFISKWGAAIYGHQMETV